MKYLTRILLIAALPLSLAACDEDPTELSEQLAGPTSSPVRDVTPASGTDDPVEQSDPVEDPVAEEPENPPDDLEPPDDVDLTITRIDVPDEVIAQTHALSASSWVLDRPAFGCDSTEGVMVAANVYELVNEGSQGAEVRIGVRTAHEGVSLTLTGATLYAYAPGVLPGSPHACSDIGEPSSTFGSELRGITVPGGGSVEFIVAGIDGNALGSYQVTIIRDDLPETDPPDVTPDPEPETDPDPTPDPDPEPGVEPMPASDYSPGCTDECAFAADGTCDDGGAGSTFSFCELGTDCTDCGVRADSGAGPTDPPPGGDPMCNDDCTFALDGVCDDGGSGSLFMLCELGSDCSDCGPRTSGGGGGSCLDTCAFALDGECDDGGPGSLWSICDLGTDCFDCGPR